MNGPDGSAITTSDGLRLEAELARASEERAAALLCHPHPEHGGTMQSIVIGALFEALPEAGVTCLRFNFRGAGASDGVHGGGAGEQLDAQAALAHLLSAVPAHTPVMAAGWSFGADIALSLRHERVGGWLAVACPLHYGDTTPTGVDPRPKWLVLGEHDEIVREARIRDLTAQWRSVHTVVVPGASHFFVGRTERVVDSALEAIATLCRDSS